MTLGGQTAINLAERGSTRWGCRSSAPSCEAIGRAENRGSFEALMERLGIPQPEGRAVTTLEEGARGREIASATRCWCGRAIVLGGRAMQIVV